MTEDSIYIKLANSGKVDEALIKCKNDLVSFENSNRYTEYADALHAMASMLKYYKSEYIKALKCLELEVQVRLLHGLPNIDSAYLKSAILNSYLDRDELVLRFAKLTLENTQDRTIKGTALNVIGDAIFKTNPDQAEEHFKEAELLFITEKNSYNLSHVLLSIARLEGFKGNIHAALRICEQELYKGHKSQNPGILGTAYLRFAEIYSFDGEVKESRAFAEKAHAIGVENSWTVLKLEAERLMP